MVDNTNSLEQRIKLVIGEQMFVIHALQLQIDELKARLAQAEAKTMVKE